MPIESGEERSAIWKLPRKVHRWESEKDFIVRGPVTLFWAALEGGKNSALNVAQATGDWGIAIYSASHVGNTEYPPKFPLWGVAYGWDPGEPEEPKENELGDVCP